MIELLPILRICIPRNQLECDKSSKVLSDFSEENHDQSRSTLINTSALHGNRNVDRAVLQPLRNDRKSNFTLPF